MPKIKGRGVVFAYAIWFTLHIYKVSLCREEQRVVNKLYQWYLSIFASKSITQRGGVINLKFSVTWFVHRPSNDKNKFVKHLG